MKTKWQILTERAEGLESTAQAIRAELAGLDRTTFGGKCTCCGEALETEGDFARHFVVPDVRYLNLGGCPVNNAGPDTRWSTSDGTVA
jgi:hypothetical protein